MPLVPVLGITILTKCYAIQVENKSPMDTSLLRRRFEVHSHIDL